MQLHMKLSAPSPQTVAEAEAVLEAAQKALQDLKDLPASATPKAKAWHDGLKVYGVCVLTIASTGLMMWQGYISIPTGIYAIYAALATMAFRRTAKTMEASIVNAQVNPSSPAAEATAAQATIPPMPANQPLPSPVGTSGFIQTLPSRGPVEGPIAGFPETK
jgi:hypothetical protein